VADPPLPCLAPSNTCLLFWLRFGLMAGSAMPSELLHRVQTVFPIPAIYTNWGMTELSSVATMTTATDPDSKKLLTAGRLLPQFTAKIVEPDTGKILPWGQRGEIVVSGFGVMDSYYRNPAQTAKAIKEHAEDAEWETELSGGDGDRHLVTGKQEFGRRKWMHTGDEAYLDDQGYFVITGRIKDLIIRGGENISPLEIEARLYEHPAVKQVVVFGVSSERFGEEVAAMVELREECHLDSLSPFSSSCPNEKELQDWVTQKLARFKVPVWLWWLGDERHGIFQEWPKTANGKLRRVDVRAKGEGKFPTSLRQFTGLRDCDTDDIWWVQNWSKRRGSLEHRNRRQVDFLGQSCDPGRCHLYAVHRYYYPSVLARI
jgi:mevalonyl-CoA ligase